MPSSSRSSTTSVTTVISHHSRSSHSSDSKASISSGPGLTDGSSASSEESVSTIDDRRSKRKHRSKNKNKHGKKHKKKSKSSDSSEASDDDDEDKSASNAGIEVDESYKDQVFIAESKKDADGDPLTPASPFQDAKNVTFAVYWQSRGRPDVGDDNGVAATLVNEELVNLGRRDPTPHKHHHDDYNNNTCFGRNFLEALAHEMERQQAIQQKQQQQREGRNDSDASLSPSSAAPQAITLHIEFGTCTQHELKPLDPDVGRIKNVRKDSQSGQTVQELEIDIPEEVNLLLTTNHADKEGDREARKSLNVRATTAPNSRRNTERSSRQASTAPQSGVSSKRGGDQSENENDSDGDNDTARNSDDDDGAEGDNEKTPKPKSPFQRKGQQAVSAFKNTGRKLKNKLRS